MDREDAACCLQSDYSIKQINEAQSKLWNWFADLGAGVELEVFRKLAMQLKPHAEDFIDFFNSFRFQGNLWKSRLRLLALRYPFNTFFGLSWSGATPNTEVLVTSTVLGISIPMSLMSKVTPFAKKEGASSGRKEIRLRIGKYNYPTVISEGTNTFSYLTHRINSRFLVKMWDCILCPHFMLKHDVRY